MEEGIEEGSPSFMTRLSAEAAFALKDIEFLVGGFDFSRIISEYYKAFINGDDEKQSACLRWLRGEYSNKTEARHALGFPVSVIINDENWYDFIKLWAVLVRKMGYRGLVVFIDECVNLYKITNRISRENNYEKILSMFNDTLQGHAEGLSIVFAGTPQFLDDTRRGLFSYEALRSRLCDSRYEMQGVKNLNSPIIRLLRLNDNELFALLKRMTDLFCQYHAWEARLTDDQIATFLQSNLQRVGSESMVTPREIIRDYMTVLNILLQNPEITFENVMTSKAQNEPQTSETRIGTTRKISATDIKF